MDGFVAYRSPHNNEVVSYSGKWKAVEQLKENKGFCVKSFEDETIWLLEPVILGWNISLEQAHNINAPSISKSQYLDMIDDAVAGIQNEELDKVVISRVLILEGKINLKETFDNLVNQYPNSFCSIFYHPNFGIWMGATPEVLVNIKGDKGSTMALAGTQAYIEGKELQWSRKEIEEQAFVRDEIEAILRNESIHDYSIGETENLRAGKIYHILNRINFTLEDHQVLPLVKALHPTSAVSGIPRKLAIEKIKMLEQHQRSCYTGFLGPIEENNAQLFVNLRCMNILENSVQLYIGGGITKDSIAENEWAETELKSTTLKNCLSFE